MSWLIDRFPKLPLYWQLTRLNRPIGIYLLLWPTMWALWIAGEGQPSIANVIIFILGVVLMRSAGCVINDYADRHLDGHVKRTKERPLAQKLISEKEALGLFATLCLAAFILVLFTNTFTIYLSIGGVALASLYPFMKRYTHLPQVVLGAAFSWAIPMAFAAQTESLPDIVWLLYCANVLWTIVYDTQYAMVDRDDDLKIGIKSTAVLFGDADKVIIAVLQSITIITWILIANQMHATWPVYSAILVAAGLFAYHQYLIRHRERNECFKAFLHNHWVGAILFAGLVGHYLLA